MSNVQNWLRLCVLTVLMTAACAVAQAQDAPMSSTTTTTSGSMDSMSMAGGPVDYSILNNQVYDYLDLRLAQELGYSDGEIASIAKIARLTGLPFKLILNRVHQGRLFALLASDYGLRLGDVLDASDEQARINEYLALYQSLSLLGTAHTAMISTAQAVSGPTLTELEATYNQLNAAFPALPPTNIETTPIGNASAETTVQNAPPPVIAPPPPPPAPPAENAPPPPPAPAAVVRATKRPVRRHHRVHRVRRHRRHRAVYKRRMAS